MYRRFQCFVALVLCTAIWGSTFAVCKLALEELPPIEMVVLRFAISLIVVSPVVIRQFRTISVHWKTLALIGFIGVTAPYALQNWALSMTSATTAGLIMASIPAMTTVFSVMLLKEPVDARRWVGILVSVTGVVILVLAAQSSSQGADTVMGNMLQVFCAASWGLYTVLSKKAISSGTPDSVIAAGSLLTGLIFCAPLAALEMSTRAWAMPSATAWLQLVYLGSLAGAGTFVLWNFGLRAFDASEASVLESLVPVWSAIGAIVLLGEGLMPYHLAGGALATGGILVALVRVNRKRRPAGIASKMDASS